MGKVAVLFGGVSSESEISVLTGTFVCSLLAGGRYEVNYLYTDFKKKGGYYRSIALSDEYGLYRQDFCGCRFSKR